jgi:phosphoglycolate phosphatase-like HAD superfamily hydrolase
MVQLPFAPDDFDAILFDMDGTLINTDDVEVARWARRAARVYRSPVQARRAARRFVMAAETPTNTLFSVLDRLGLDTPVVRLMIALQGGTEHGEAPPPIDGIVHMIPRLAQRYALGIVSTRTSAETVRYLQVLGLHSYFRAVAGRDTTWRIKPHPQPVEYAVRQIGVPPGRCLMVGDTTVDVKAGRRAGARTCAVLCGFGEQAELERAGADVILEHTALLGSLMAG